MPLGLLTYDFYEDDELTTPFSGTFQTEHLTDLSDNPQDFVLYFGSNTDSRILKAASSPGVDEITITPAIALSEWQSNHAYSVGATIEPTTPNGLKYRCTSAGTSHTSTEPTWPTSGIGSTISDGTCLWALIGARHEVTEITLALTGGDLDTNTPGDPLNIGTEIESEAVNAVAIYIRIENAVTTVNNNTGYPDLRLDLNQVREDEVIV